MRLLDRLVQGFQEMMWRPRFVIIAVLALFISSAHSSADILWFNTETNRVYYEDGITPLFGFKGNSAISSFVQLLYAGANGVIDTAWIDASNGAGGDDVVVAWSYIAAGLPGTAGSTSHYGAVSGGIFGGAVAGNYYYVRVWNTPSPDFGAGVIPLSPTSYYGNSSLFQAQITSPGDIEEFDFGGANGFSTIFLPIPEPNLMTAALGGLLVWACLFRRRRAPHE